MDALFRKNQNAFSLIEIIIAITIIAIFTVLPILAYSSYQKKARDEKRKSDLGKISQALESYKAEKGTYPPDLDTLVSSGYLPEVPKDPLNGQLVPWDTNGGTFGYAFSSPDGSSYTLSATMEEGGASGGGAGGSGSSAFPGGNIAGTFTGSGNGAINSTTISVNGIVTNNLFKGSFNGTVGGNGISGTINGILNKSVTGTAQGNVAGTATLTVGTVNGTNFVGTYTGFNVTGVAGGGAGGGGGSVCIATPQKPSCEVIPVVTLTMAAQLSPTDGAPIATGYLSPTVIGTITTTPTNTPTSAPSNTPTNTPISSVTPTNTPTNTPSPTPRFWFRTLVMPYSNYTNTLLMYPKNATSIIGVGGRYTGSSYYSQLSDIAGSGILTQNRMISGNAFNSDIDAYTPTSDGGAFIVTHGQGMLKLDSSFNITWSRAMSTAMYATSVDEIPGVGYVISGYSTSGAAFTMKVDTAGNFLWEKDYSINWQGPYGSTIYGNYAKVAYSSTSGKIVAMYSWQENGGQIFNYDLSNEYTVRETIIYKFVYDSNGNVLSSENIIGVNQYQTPGNYYDVEDNFGVISLTSTADGGFAALHPISTIDSAYGTDTNNRTRFIKMDSNGTITNRFDIDLGQWPESGNDVLQTSDGGYLISMRKYKFNPGYINQGPTDGTDIVLEKLTAAYAHSWTKVINVGGYEDVFKATQMTNGDILLSGYYAPGGATTGNKLLIKMDSTGGVTGCSSIATTSLVVGAAPTATVAPGGGRATITPVASGSPFYTQTNGSSKTTSNVTLTITNPTDTQGAFCQLMN